MRRRLAVSIAVLVAFTAVLYAFFSTLIFVPEKQIVVIGKTMDDTIEFWKNVKEGLSAAAEEYHIKYEYVAPQTEKDIEEQIALVKDVVLQKPDAIILSAADSELLNESVRNIQAAGIPLVTMDSGVDYSPAVPFVGTDNYNAGLLTAEQIKTFLEPGKKVVVLNHYSNAQTGAEREQGIVDGLGADLVAGTYNCYASDGEAYEVTVDVLGSGATEIGCICAINEVVARGAARAVSDLGLSGSVKLAVFDSSQELIRFIENGTVTVAVVQKPFNMGYLAMKSAFDLIHYRNIPAETDTGIVIINKNNLFTPENQKLLFSFQ